MITLLETNAWGFVRGFLNWRYYRKRMNPVVPWYVFLFTDCEEDCCGHPGCWRYWTYDYRCPEHQDDP